jgi:hypothetical protein
MLGGLKLAVGAGQVFAHPLHSMPVVMLDHPCPRNTCTTSGQRSEGGPLSCVRDPAPSGRLWACGVRPYLLT